MSLEACKCSPVCSPLNYWLHGAWLSKLSSRSKMLTMMETVHPVQVGNPIELSDLRSLNCLSEVLPGIYRPRISMIFDFNEEFLKNFNFETFFPWLSIRKQVKLNDFNKLHWCALVPKNCAWTTFYTDFEYGGHIMAVGGRVGNHFWSDSNPWIPRHPKK